MLTLFSGSEDFLLSFDYDDENDQLKIVVTLNQNQMEIARMAINTMIRKIDCSSFSVKKPGW